MSMAKGFVLGAGKKNKWSLDKRSFDFFNLKLINTSVNEKYIDIYEKDNNKTLCEEELEILYRYIDDNRKLFYMLYSKRYLKGKTAINEVMQKDFKTYLKRLPYKLDYYSNFDLDSYTIKNNIFTHKLIKDTFFQAELVSSFEYTDCRIHLMTSIEDEGPLHKYLLVEFTENTRKKFPEIHQVEYNTYRVHYDQTIGFHLYGIRGYEPKLFKETR